MDLESMKNQPNLTPDQPTGGVKSYPIEGPMLHERYRVRGMTDAERAWRKQWLNDQILSPNEPRPLPASYYEANFNPIRRMYRFPLDSLFRALIPILGERTAIQTRYVTGKVLIGAAAFFWTAYYFKYNTQDWTRKYGWTVYQSKKAVYPGDPGFPYVSSKKPSEYCSINDNFDKSPI